MLTDNITVLRARNGRLCKTIHPGGRIETYGPATQYDLFAKSLPHLFTLAKLLKTLASRNDCCVVRGGIIDPARTVGVRRLAFPDPETGETATLEECPHRWLAIDLDNLPLPSHVPSADLVACGMYARNLLPTEFRSAEAIVVANPSHGIKTGARLRLWFWCSRAIGRTEIELWLIGSPVDPSIFRPAQPTYTASPIFAGGAVDPIPSRLSMLSGNWPVVRVPLPEALANLPRQEGIPSKTAVAAKTQHRVRMMIARALQRVGIAPEGHKHPALRAASCTIGGLLHYPGVSESDALRHLVAAAAQAGAASLELAEDTARWGLARGRLSPLNVEARP